MYDDDRDRYENDGWEEGRLTRREVRVFINDLEEHRDDLYETLNEKIKDSREQVRALQDPYEILMEAKNSYNEDNMEEVVKEHAPRLEHVRSQAEEALKLDGTHVSDITEDFYNHKFRARKIMEGNDRGSADSKDFEGQASTIRDKIKQLSEDCRRARSSYQPLIKKEEQAEEIRNKLPELLKDEQEYGGPREVSWSEDDLEGYAEHLSGDDDIPEWFK